MGGQKAQGEHGGHGEQDKTAGPQESQEGLQQVAGMVGSNLR